MELGNCLLSIIIPYYNGKDYIKENIESMISINLEKEIIIVNDGSSELDTKYISELVKNEPTVKLYSKTNGGIVSARNFGVEKANGKYILFVDQDDLVISDVVEDAIHNLEQTSCDALFWSTGFLNSDMSISECDKVLVNGIADDRDIRSNLIPGILFGKKTRYARSLGHIWAAVYKREIISTHNIFFKRMYDCEDDYLFVFDYLLASNSVMFYEKKGYLWRVNYMSYSHSKRYIEGIYEKLVYFYEYIEQQLIEHQIDVAIVQKFHIYALQNILVKYMKNEFANSFSVSRFKVFKKTINESGMASQLAKYKCLIKDWQFRIIYSFVHKKMYMTSALLIRFYTVLKEIKHK